MRQYVTLVVILFISIGADQASNIYYSSNPHAIIYDKYLNSLRDSNDVKHMMVYLNNLAHAIMRKTSNIWYIHPVILRTRYGVK